MAMKDVEMRKVRVIAHRGFSGRYPENTIVAFQRAVETGTDEIEFDVKLTADGEIVILHDTNVDRTTNGTGNVADMNLSHIKSLDAGGRFGQEFKGTVIPTLKEALESIPENVELNVHVHDSSPELVTKTLKILMEQNRIDNAYLAIKSEVIPAVRGVYPRIKICNMAGQSYKTGYIEETRKWGCERLQFYTPSYELTEDLVKNAHAHGIFVNVFFADTEEIMSRYIEFGVDAILTNYPDILVSLLRRD
jgi:glycerophosphoryl diester phosphodiesterase